ncbi:FAD-dependent oxidoreductase [Peterkaempfera sp. SMS 1(5)a]|uniref:FAD-dependent oxidoreductase n=1 Tax=Peterkaempfera podocarpi TaxID=3232308 RepID=UPI00366FCFEB
MSRQHTRTALVVGGGIGGPIAAMALAQAGIEATVHEAYSTVADGVGGALSLAPNGLDALDAIGVGDAVRRIGTPMTGMVLENWKHRPLATFGSIPGIPPQQFLWRGELYRTLHDAARQRGIAIHHGKRLVTAEETGDGVVARFADGTTAEADVLIGADGIRSTVRRLIDPQAPQPTYHRLLGFGGRLPDAGLPSTGGQMHMSFGRRAFFGWMVDADGSGGWFINLPWDEPMSASEATARGAAHWLPLLRAAVADDRTPALRLVDRLDPADLVMTGSMESMARVPQWSRGRLVITGDAAHAPSSSSGQGASLTAESAVQLARCLRDLPHQEAFAAYEALRRTRVERIIKAAARTNSDKAAGPVARVVRDALMPMAMRLMKPEKQSWQFTHHIDWQAPVG